MSNIKDIILLSVEAFIVFNNIIDIEKHFLKVFLFKRYKNVCVINNIQSVSSFSGSMYFMISEKTKPSFGL